MEPDPHVTRITIHAEGYQGTQDLKRAGSLWYLDDAQVGPAKITFFRGPVGMGAVKITLQPYTYTELHYPPYLGPKNPL